MPPSHEKLNRIDWETIKKMSSIKLYAGDIVLFKEHPDVIGLSLIRNDHRHIRHDITNPLPLPDDSVDSFQAEDVFEHIEYDRLLPVVNEVYRVLKPGSNFRLSVPDYGCDVLYNRCDKDLSGNIVFDPEGGGTRQNPGHVWFPRIDSVKKLLENSDFGKSGEIEYLHCYRDDSFVVKTIDYSKGHVLRTPDFDKRVQNPYRPMSMVIDLIKGDKKCREAIALNEKGGEIFSKGDISNILTIYKKAIEATEASSLKFVQIHTFYPGYLEQFYKANSSLPYDSHQEQIDALLLDGFSVSHLFAPYMAKIGYDGHLIIANNHYTQRQWLLENKVGMGSEKSWQLEAARVQVERLKPDILYLSDPISFDDRFVESLSWKPSLIVGWRAAAIPDGVRWSRFDLMLSHLSVCRKKALALGAKKALHFFPGFPESLADVVDDVPKSWDVVFSGQASPEHRRRNDFLVRMAEAGKDKENPFSVGFFIASPDPNLLPPDIIENNHGARWGREMYKTLKSGRIVINAEINLARGDAGNMRLFETTGAGSFCLTEHQDNIQDYFEPGVEIETFRDAGELVEKIRYYLAHPEEREAIARRGRDRCRGEYSMTNRTREFERIIRDYMPASPLRRPSAAAADNTGGTDNTEEVERLLSEAERQLNANNNEQALLILDQALALTPDNPGLYYGKAMAVARLGRLEEAAELLNHLLSIAPDHQKGGVLLEAIRSRLGAPPSPDPTPRAAETRSEAAPAAQSVEESGETGMVEETLTIEETLQRAMQYVGAGDLNNAMTLLSALKSMKVPTKGLDLLRGICFSKMNQHSAAMSALREELRYFPDQGAAREMLDRIEAGEPDPGASEIDDSEFNGLMEIIRPYTMVGEPRLYSLFSLAKRVCLQDLPGNFVECGVAAGGSSALLAHVIKRHSKRTRRLFSFDSFEGMPTPGDQDVDPAGKSADASGWGAGTCAAPEESLKEVCEKLGVRHLVTPVKGYFEQVLPEKRDEVGEIAFLHMDGDWYESTRAIIDNLYDRVVDDGFIQVDDYGFWRGCKKALQEFQTSRKLRFDMKIIDDTGVWFKKPA